MCQFPTGQSPTRSSSDRRNYDSRESYQQTQGLTENKPPLIRKHYVVISRPFAANVVPKLVAMATSLRPSISVMSSLDSVSPKTHPLESNSMSLAVIQVKLQPIKSHSGCYGNVPQLQGIGSICILLADHSNPLHNQSLVTIVDSC